MVIEEERALIGELAEKIETSPEQPNVEVPFSWLRFCFQCMWCLFAVLGDGLFHLCCQEETASVLVIDLFYCFCH